jgi:hypothetical protein
MEHVIFQIGLALNVDLVILQETALAFNVDLLAQNLGLLLLVEVEKRNDREIGIVLVDF